jgi:hypothetical protein
MLMLVAPILGACNLPPPTAPGPDAPRNGEGLYVDPRYGTLLPGGPPVF